MTSLRLRPWQEEALAKAERWLLDRRADKRFLINAAPGAGKTIPACLIAQRMIERGDCRPVTFHRHEGLFTVDLDDTTVQVSGHTEANLPPELRRLPGLQTALNFYRLACKPQFEADDRTPLLTGYQATMIECASDKLTELQHRMPEAGGLVIAPDIEMAEYIARVIEMIEGEATIIVHN